jgi:translation initiation factor IF-2
MDKEKKIKVVQVAKDLGIEADEVVEKLAKVGRSVKKTGSIGKADINLLLEKFTLDNQVESFEEYFADRGKNSLETAKNSDKNQNIQNSQKVQKKSENSVEENKKTSNSEKKSEKAEMNNVKKTKDNNQEPKKNNNWQKNSKDSSRQSSDQKKFKKSGNFKSDHQANKSDNRNSNKFFNKKDENAKTAPVKEKNAENRDKSKEFVKENNKAKSVDKFAKKDADTSANTSSAKAVDTAVKSTETAENQQKKKNKVKKAAEKQEHGQKTKLGTGMVSSDKKDTISKQRTVDTRGSYVDLDKYNERYENIASSNSKVNDNYGSRKQKINQKSQQYNKNGGKNRKKNDHEDTLKKLELERARKKQLEVKIPENITVGELANRLKVTAIQVIKTLMTLGVMATINEELDFDTASLVAEELGAKVEKEVIVTIEERLIDDTEDPEETLKPRCPVVVIMGHVDHGKTSILDRIRNSHVTSTEAGGITQHIGAYQVKYEGKDITFLDTPGHEAFTSMRARGANITDIAILVVAADDGVMPQTVESINHAKAANIPVIVAINKMDAEGANPERIKEELTKYEMVCEDWGGDVACIPVSAKTGEGIDDLLEQILLVAEVEELKANPDRLAKGTVIEARLDKGRGPIATLLVEKGTLKKGDIIIAGTAVGRVRVMTNHLGKQVKQAGPSVPVEITGLAEVPSAGDTFNAVEDEKLARSLVEQRKNEIKETKFNSFKKVTLDNLFSQIEEGEMKELPIIVKADVQGSVEAVKQSLEKLSNDEVRVRVIHSGVGAVKESDVMLADASNAIIVGFNVRPDPVAAENAKRDGVDIHLYRVIYDAIEEIETAMKGMLAPKTREVELGRIEVRQVYKISNVGLVAGSYVLKGKAVRNAKIRIVRDGIIVADDVIAGLKRFKDDAKEVAEGYECGISLEKFNDIKTGDIFEAYQIEEYQD